MRYKPNGYEDNNLRQISRLTISYLQPNIRVADAELQADGKKAGHLTSVGYSVKLNSPLALGYVRRQLAAPGTELRGQTEHGVAFTARVVSLPLK